MKISYSRVSLYLSCPRAHWYRYVKRLSKLAPERPLYFGTDFHKLLELRNQPKELKQAKERIKDAYYEMPASWQSDLGENYPEDLFTIFKDYQKVYEGTRQPQVTELDFCLPVGEVKGEKLEFVGKIDELYLLKRKGVKLITIGEHKTFNQKPNMELLVMNTQKCLYAKAVQILKGILPDKVKWDYIKSTPAEEPVWLEKSGRFSASKSTKITQYSWLRACKARDIVDPDVVNKANDYSGNIPEFFFQMELDIDPAMVEDCWEGFLYTARQIMRTGEKNKTRNITRNCSYCTYRDICYTELTGGDADYIIAKDFKEG